MAYELHYFLKSRRSIRHFKPNPVPAETIQRILETAICAPSAHNLQPWRFVVLTDTIVKKRFAEALVSRFQHALIKKSISDSDNHERVAQTMRRVGEAPVVIVLCRDRKSVKPQPSSTSMKAERLLGVQSVALAGLQLILAAYAEGLGSCWICWPLFASKETCHILEIPTEWEPQGMIFLGYPNEAPEMPTRTPVTEITKYL